jgi:hypothetical protein
VRTGGRRVERGQKLDQLIHLFSSQYEVSSYGRMTSQGDQNGMNHLLSPPILFEQREFIQYLSGESFGIPLIDERRDGLNGE